MAELSIKPARPKREVRAAGPARSYAAVARVPKLDPFVRMTINPFDVATMVRYPDGLSRATGLSRLIVRDVRPAVAADATHGMATCLAWKLCPDRSDAILAPDETFPMVSPAGVPSRAVLAGSLGQMGEWADLAPTGSTTGAWAENTGYQAVSLWRTYPGYDAYYDVADTERTLAMAVKLECSGLPPGQFAYSGRVYGLYITAEDFYPGNSGVVTPPYPKGAGTFVATVNQVAGGSMKSTSLTEAYCMDAVTAGTGVTMTLADVARSPGGFVVPWFPSGAGERTFRPTGAPRTDPTACMAYNVNSTGVPVGNLGAFGSDTRGAIEPGFIYMVAFGVTAGTVLTTTYCHIMEYVPEPGASSLVNPRIERLDTVRRDAIEESVADIAREGSGEDGAYKLGSTIRRLYDAGKRGYQVGSAFLEGVRDAAPAFMPAAGGAGAAGFYLT